MNGLSAELVTDDLPAPRIREVSVPGLLNPVAVRYSCTIVMEYVTEDGDLVSVTWAGAQGAGSYTSGFFSVGVLRPLEVGIGGPPLVIFNQGTTVTVTYTVKRGNSPAVTSQPLILYVLPLSQGDLPRPFIPQATDSGEGVVLDLNTLTEFTLWINAWPLLIWGQYFWLQLSGINADDSVFNKSYWSPPNNVVGQEFTKGFYAQSYSADPLKGLKNQSVLRLKLMVNLKGAQDMASAQNFAHRNYIVETTPGNPRTLSIKEAPDNKNLHPLAATQSLTAVVDDDLEPNVRISATWTAAPGTPAAGSQTTVEVLSGSTRPIEIPLRVSLVAFSVGKKAEVTFTCRRGASPPVTSPPFLLDVLTIPPAALIAPVITQANGTTVLDLKDVTAGATLLFGGWPHMATGQRIGLVLEGVNASGASHNLTVWTSTRNAVHRSWVMTKIYSITIAYSYLRELRNGSNFSIHFEVNLDQIANPATAVVFDARVYTVRSTP